MEALDFLINYEELLACHSLICCHASLPCLSSSTMHLCQNLCQLLQYKIYITKRAAVT